MPFIGRPNINYGAFERKDEPSTAQAIIQALSGILGSHVDARDALAKRKADLADKKELLDMQLQEERNRRKEMQLADIAEERLKQGGELRETAAPPAMSMQPSIDSSIVGQLQSPDFMQRVLQRARGQAPEGSLRIADIRKMLGLPEDLPSSRQYLTSGKGKAVDPVKTESQKVDLELKKKRLASAGKGPDEISRLIRIRGQLISELNNALTSESSREELRSQVDEIDKNLGSKGLPGFNDDMASDFRDAREAIRRGMSEEDAKARLQKAYPGLAPLFKKDPTLFQKLLETIQGD